MECNILVSILFFFLSTIVRVQQLSLCFCGLPDHIDRDKKLLMDFDEHSSSIMGTLYLFCINISIHFHENL